MQNIFTVNQFAFPYDYKFPGQASDERILFVTRENPIMLWLRRAGVIATVVMVMVVGMWLGSLLQTIVGIEVAVPVQILSLVIGVVFGLVGWWWVSTLWAKSLALVTTQRLTKVIYSTPFNRHFLSLPLDMIVDTGSYEKGFIQALFKLGTFTARSSASSSGVATDDPERVNKKYFYIENIAAGEDLQHYVNKLLYAFRHHHEHLATFRPFIPNLKGDARKQFMEKYPDFWS
jgi:hypothetical protein